MSFYRPGDPRWNRTIQNIAENFEHANESAQENIYTFTQRYIDPCFASITQCFNACTAPCIPTHNDRRRHRRSRGREELSFDFYDDWDEDEVDGLLGWGSDNIERLLGVGSNYGTMSQQPDRQRAMTYGQRQRDSRYDTSRRKPIVHSRDGATDPTIIPTSAYFGFLDRLPFKVGGRGLRYKPSSAGLTEHPGALPRDEVEGEEGEPLLDDIDEQGSGNEHKGHRRKRSNTQTSARTTDSLSSRGDIFPSEDELEDAVALDDEFTISLERRPTGQWNEDSSSNKARSSNSKRRSAMSTRTTSLRKTRESMGKMSDADSALNRSSPENAEDIPSLDELHKEEERLRLREEAGIHRKCEEAQQLAVKRRFVPELQIKTPAVHPKSSHALSPQSQCQMTTVQSSLSPRVRSPAQSPVRSLISENVPPLDSGLFPSFVDSQTMPDSSSFHVDDSDYSSMAPTPNRPLSLRNEPRRISQDDAAEFVPAKLPHFGNGVGGSDSRR